MLNKLNLQQFFQSRDSLESRDGHIKETTQDSSWHLTNRLKAREPRKTPGFACLETPYWSYLAYGNAEA